MYHLQSYNPQYNSYFLAHFAYASTAKMRFVLVNAVLTFEPWPTTTTITTTTTTTMGARRLVKGGARAPPWILT